MLEKYNASFILEVAATEDCTGGGLFANKHNLSSPTEGNMDRHHYETFEKFGNYTFLLHLDNGRA